MNQATTFTGYLKNEQPRLWESLCNAAEEGLIVIDEANDSVTATNRLLLTYPDLHTVLSFLVDTWVKRKTEEFVTASAAFIKEAQGNHG